MVTLVLGAASVTLPMVYALSRVAPVNVTELGLFDPSGTERIKEFELGQQVALRTTIQNTLDTTQPFVIMSEIRDSSGVTVFLVWQSGTLKPDGNYTMETSWTPNSACWMDYAGCNQYELRSFTVTGLENPQVLSEVKTSGGITILETTFNGNRISQFLLEGREYQIEYSMDSGFIQIVTADIELSTLKMQVERVTHDTDFTFKVPKTLLAELLRCGGEEPASLEHLPEPLGFADSIPISFTTLDWGAESATLKTRLDAGTEEVEIVAGGCIA